MTTEGANVPQTLSVFLCHSSGDKAAVRSLYRKLKQEGFEPWLDEVNLLPGQRWEHAIAKAVRDSDVVIVCLSASSISKRGFVHKEIKSALDVADQQPDDAIYLIPLRLEECAVPERLSSWQWVDLYDETGFGRLTMALRRRALELGKNLPSQTPPGSEARDDGPRLLEPIKEMMRGGLWDDAIESLERVLAVEDNAEEATALLRHARRQKELAELESNYAAGYDHLRADRLEEALSCFQKVRSKDPDYRGTKNFIERCEREIAKRETAALFNEAQRAGEAGDWGKAVEKLRQVPPEDPRHKEARERLAEAERQQALHDLYMEGHELYRSGDRRGALAAFKQITESVGGYKDVVSRVAKIEREEAEAEAARREREQAESEESARRLRAAEEELAGGQWEPAIEKLQELAERGRSGEEVRDKLAQAQLGHIRQRQREKMFELYARGQGLYKAGDQLGAWLCLMLFRQGAGDDSDVVALTEKINNEQSRLYRVKLWLGLLVTCAALMFCVAATLYAVGVIGVGAPETLLARAAPVLSIGILLAGLLYLFSLRADSDSLWGDILRLGHSPPAGGDGKPDHVGQGSAPPAEAMLSTRLNSLTDIGGGRAIDSSYVTRAEYQLFIDAGKKAGEYNHPDHWVESKYTVGTAHQPVSGVRDRDAARFCEWLTLRAAGRQAYRLPRPQEALKHPVRDASLAAWCFDGRQYSLVGLGPFGKRAIRAQLRKLSKAGLPLPVSLAKRLEVKRNIGRAIDKMPQAVARATGIRLYVASRVVDCFTGAVALDLSAKDAFMASSDLAIMLDLKVGPSLLETNAESITPFAAVVSERDHEKARALHEKFAGDIGPGSAKAAKLLTDLLSIGGSKTLLSRRLAQREYAARVLECAYAGYELLCRDKQKSDPRSALIRMLVPNRSLRRECAELKTRRREVLEFYWWVLIVTAREDGELPSWEGIRLVSARAEADARRV